MSTTTTTTTSSATGATHRQPYYTTISNPNDQLFQDDQIQRFDADTIKTRYGENWKSLASNVREVTQPDGSIIKEYIIEDPSMLEQMQGSSRNVDSTSSATASDDEQQHPTPSRNKFAEIKARFEQKHSTQVMGSPSTTSGSGSQTTSASTARQTSHKPSDDLYAKHRRGSNESIPVNRMTSDNESIGSSQVSNRYVRSQSIGTEKSKGASFRRLNSADEADEEVSRIHRQGEESRRHNHDLSPISSTNEPTTQNRIQYEVVDEDGNPLAIDGVQNLIQMSGVRAREVTQSDGSVVKEYVIDDPQLLAKFRSQSSRHGSPTASTSYAQPSSSKNDAPPPPPRVPLRQPLLFRQGPPTQDTLPANIQQIHALEPQRRYEFVTGAGRRVQFLITNVDDFNGKPITDSEIRELSNAIQTRLAPTSTAPAVSQPTSQAQFTLPKPWHPSVDLTQRAPVNRQRIGSDTQPFSNESHHNPVQHAPADLTRSASYGVLNQGSYASQPYPQHQHQQQQQQQVYNQPTIDWSAFQQQDPQGQIDQNMVRQVIQQRHQNNGPFQTSAQFLPQQQQQQQQQPQHHHQATMMRPTKSPPMNNNPPVFYQQSTAYPYQGQQQQQHASRVLNSNGYDLNQARLTDGHARI